MRFARRGFLQLSTGEWRKAADPSRDATFAGVRFTWQPHGSQFTIIEDVPENRLAIRIKAPAKLDKDDVLDAIKFDPSWVTLI